MQRILTAALAFMLLGLPADAQQRPKTGGTLVYATGTDVQTLDPQFVTDVPTSRIVMHIHETLVKPDEAGTMQPALATSWSTSDDKLTWTFKLRQGVRFHDGTPFNAAAVKATFDRIRDPATASPRRSALAAITDIKVVDDHTIALVTKEPFAPLLAQISAYNLAIMSPAQVQKAGAGYREQPAGTGPFKSEELATGRAHHARAQRRLLGREAEARRAGDARGAGGFRARAAAAQRRGRRDRVGADRDAEAAGSPHPP